jgi:hypothetical protein
MKKSIAVLIARILIGFVGVIAVTIGIMYLTGAFNPPHVEPTGIYCDTGTDGDNNTTGVASYYASANSTNFSIKISANEKDVTEKDINLSVVDNQIISVPKTAKIGEDIPITFTKDADGNVFGGEAVVFISTPNGKYSTLCKVFVDSPVKKLTINASTDSVITTEKISILGTDFYPTQSKNPSINTNG